MEDISLVRFDTNLKDETSISYLIHLDSFFTNSVNLLSQAKKISKAL